MRVGLVVRYGLDPDCDSMLARLLPGVFEDDGFESVLVEQLADAPLDGRPALLVTSLMRAEQVLEHLRDRGLSVPVLVVTPRRSIGRLARLDAAVPLESIPATTLTAFDLRRAVRGLDRFGELHRQLEELSERLQRAEETRAQSEHRIDELTTQLALLRDDDSKPTTRQEYSMRRIEESIEMARRYDVPLSCLLVGLHGAQGGELSDAVLARVAGRLKRCVRSTDLITLYGKDQFLVLSPFTNRKAALALARRLLSEMSEQDASGLEVRIGVAGFASPMKEPQDLMRKAAEALERARSSELGIEAL